jgi:hypothetical protein
MEELHPVITESATWVWRLAAGLVVFICLSILYGTVEDLVLSLQIAQNSVDVFEAAVGALMRTTFFLVLGAVAGGFVWGIARAYLRLANGYLEYRWKFWRWDCLQRVDLRLVTEATIGEQITSYRGRTSRHPAILFRKKKQTQPPSPGKREMSEEEMILPLPKGVPEQAAELFLQKVNQEIKHLSGGW